jgi:hypothetical protein
VAHKLLRRCAMGETLALDATRSVEGQDTKAAQGRGGRTLQRSRWLTPALVGTLITAIPTYIELGRSIRVHSDYGRSLETAEQRALYEKNGECVKSLSYSQLTTTEHARIETVVCPSGDVLVRSLSPRGSMQRWVPLAATLPGGLGLLTAVVSSAYADTGDRVICQRWGSAGRLLQRIQTAAGVCYDQVIDVAHGQIVSTTPAPCSSHC